MVQLSRESLLAYRRQTYRCDPSLRLHHREEAIQFVNQRGFIFFWPISTVPLPSLWAAVAGDRPVADEHDDPGHITWGWKDELLGQGIWYYGRVLARKNCMISLETLPYFYALSPNYGEPEADYLEDYRRGSLPLEAKNVYETLLKEGPMDSIALRRAAHLSSPGSDSRFNHALEILQTSFRVVPIGTSTNGAWHYSFVYDLFHRHFPTVIDQSRLISEKAARSRLLITYFYAVGACTLRDMSRIFRWEMDSTKNTLSSLIETHQVVSDIQIEGEKQAVYCLPQIL
jgi:hypothetical protein